jgi:hypothetical protein
MRDRHPQERRGLEEASQEIAVRTVAEDRVVVSRQLSHPLMRFTSLDRARNYASLVGAGPNVVIHVEVNAVTGGR